MKLLPPPGWTPGTVHCRTCDTLLPSNALVCSTCGAPPWAGAGYCQTCGAPTYPTATICTACGSRLGAAGARSKLTAGLLGIFLGGLGVHRFYLGYTGIGVAQIVVTILTCGLGSLWGFIEGIMILVGSIDRDAEGRPLTD